MRPAQRRHGALPAIPLRGRTRSRCPVPELDRTVAVRDGEPGPVGRDRHRFSRDVQAGRPGSGLPVPELHLSRRSVRRGVPAAVRRYRNNSHLVSRTSPQNPGPASRFRVPEQHPAVAVHGDQPPPVPDNINPVHLSCTAHVPRLSGDVGIPDPYRPVDTGAGQPPPVRGDRHGIDRSRVADVDGAGAAFFGLQVPQPDGPVLPAR